MAPCEVVHRVKIKVTLEPDAPWSGGFMGKRGPATLKN